MSTKWKLDGNLWQLVKDGSVVQHQSILALDFFLDELSADGEEVKFRGNNTLGYELLGLRYLKKDYHQVAGVLRSERVAYVFRADCIDTSLDGGTYRGPALVLSTATLRRSKDIFNDARDHMEDVPDFPAPDLEVSFDLRGQFS